MNGPNDCGDLLEQVREAMTIYDRLRDDHGYRGSYASVSRWLTKLRPKTPADKKVCRYLAGPQKATRGY